MPLPQPLPVLFLLLLALLPQKLPPLASAAYASPEPAVDDLYNSPQPNVVNLPAVNKSRDLDILNDIFFDRSVSAQTAASHALRHLLPGCAKTCLADDSHSTEPCQSWNLLCICTSKQSILALADCYMNWCDVTSSMVAANLTTFACHDQHSSRSRSFFDLNIVLAVLSSLTIILRLAYKFAFLRSDLGLDDAIVAATLGTNLAETYVSARMSQHGLGQNIWTLSWYSSLSFVYYFFIDIALYFALISLIKLDLLLFYLRIFSRPAVRRLLWATIVFTCAFSLASLLVAVFQCWPVNFYWRRYMGNSNGHCIRVNVFGWVNAAVCIAIDIWILVIAFSQLYQVRLVWEQKLQVAAMFIVGGLFTVASIIRLHSLIEFGNFENPSWRQFWLIVWSTTEINVGIICVSMPALRLIAVHLSRRAGRIGLASSLRRRYQPRLDNTVQSKTYEVTSRQPIFAYGLGYGYDYAMETQAPPDDEQGTGRFDIGFERLMGLYHRVRRHEVNGTDISIDLHDISATECWCSSDNDKPSYQSMQEDCTKQPQFTTTTLHEEFSDDIHGNGGGIHVSRSYCIESSRPDIEELTLMSTAVQPHTRNINVWKDDR